MADVLQYFLCSKQPLDHNCQPLRILIWEILTPLGGCPRPNWEHPEMLIFRWGLHKPCPFCNPVSDRVGKLELDAIYWTAKCPVPMCSAQCSPIKQVCVWHVVLLELQNKMLRLGNISLSVSLNVHVTRYAFLYKQPVYTLENFQSTNCTQLLPHTQLYVLQITIVFHEYISVWYCVHLGLFGPVQMLHTHIWKLSSRLAYLPCYSPSTISDTAL